jgi:drug/metabolite transporter (DMT)-like permease
MSERASHGFVVLFMGLMVLIGSCNTIFNKFLLKTKSLDSSFDHAFFSTFMMFIGETFCYFAFKIYELRKKPEELSEKLTNESKSELVPQLPPINPFILALPGLCDFFGSTIMTFALVYLPGSVYQMTRGSIMIFTAIFSILFLKSRIYRHQISSLVCIFIGIGIVGLATLGGGDDSGKKDDDDKDAGMLIVSFVGLIIAQLFSATQFVVEEKIVNKYEVHPLQMVGWEGIWGSLFYMIVLVGIYFIDCEHGNSLCYSYIEDGQKLAKLDNWIFALKQMVNSSTILIFTAFYICCISFYNYIGITITKYVSSPARAVMDNARTVLIWAFFLIPVWDSLEGYDGLQETFKILQLIGFIFLIIGTLVYNEFIIVPFFGLDKFTKANLQKIKDEEEATRAGP